MFKVGIFVIRIEEILVFKTLVKEHTVWGLLLESTLYAYCEYLNCVKLKIEQYNYVPKAKNRRKAVLSHL